MSNRNQRLVTEEGYADLEDELARLEGPGRREIAERIKVAREFGDVSENAEYDDAKNDQALLEQRIAKLRERLRRAEVVKKNGNGSTNVQVGCKVTFSDGKAEHTVIIVGHGEANVAAGRISAASPVGSALMGCRKGDETRAQAPKGRAKKLTVLKIG